MKTPEQMAEEYADDWHKDCDYPAEILRHTKKATETVFLAGYKAGCTNTQSELAVGREVVEFLLEKPQWISVKERLPVFKLYNQNDDSGYTKNVLMRFVWGRIRISNFEKVDGIITTSYGNDLNEVTHWMPLPEPPREEK